jgi:hypothetical protein
LAALVDIDWDVPPGRVAHPGGDSLCRVSALKEIGGWNADLIACEDPDLGFRMTDAGWQVLRLADDMTSHDIAMKTLWPYFRRAVRSGYAYAEVGWRNRNGCGRAWLRHAVGIVLYGAMLPLITMALLALYWPLVIVPALLYTRMFACMLRYVRGRGRPLGIAARYAILNAACKPAAAWGVGRYLLDVIAGRRGRLIEYKPGVGSPGSAAITRAAGALERRA